MKINIIKWIFTLVFASLAMLYAFDVLEASNGQLAVAFLCFAWMAYSAKVKVTHKDEE